MKRSIESMQKNLLAKQREMEEFQLSCLAENNIEFEKVKIRNQLELAYAKEIESKISAIDQLRKDNEGLEKANKVLEAKLNSSMKDHQKSYDMLKDAHRFQSDNLLKEIEALQEKLDYHTSNTEKREFNSEIERLQSKVTALELELETSSQQIEHLSHEKAAELVDYSKQISALKEQVGELKIEREKLILENETLIGDNRQLQTNTKIIESEIYKEIQQKKKIESLVLEKERRIEQLETELHDLKRLNLGEMEDLYQEKKHGEETMGAEIRDLEEQVKEQKLARERMKKDFSHKIQGMVGEMTNYQKRNNELNSQKNDVEEIRDGYKQQLEDSRNQARALQSDLEKMEEDLRVANYNNRKLERELDEIQKAKGSELARRLEKKHAENMSKANESVKILTDQNKAMKAELEGLKAQNIKQRKLISKLNKKLVGVLSKKVLAEARNSVSPQSGVPGTGMVNGGDPVGERIARDKEAFMEQMKAIYGPREAEIMFSGVGAGMPLHVNSPGYRGPRPEDIERSTKRRELLRDQVVPRPQMSHPPGRIHRQPPGIVPPVPPDHRVRIPLLASFNRFLDDYEYW